MSWDESAQEGEASAESTGKRRAPSAERLAAQLLEPSDLPFLDALRKVGLLGEMDDEELLRVASEVEETTALGRRIQLLEIYFAAGGDVKAAERRRLADRFFLRRVGEQTTARGLLTALSELVPELGGISLERIGGEEGPLVARAGEHVSAIADDDADDTATGTVSIRSLVRAVNGLMARDGVRIRLVPLEGDDRRELYVGLGITEAIELAMAELLEENESERLMELASW